MSNGPPDSARATNVSLGAAIVAFINAIMALFVSFGLNLSAQQQTSIQGVVNAFVLVVLAVAHVYGQITAERERWSHLDGLEGDELPGPPRRPPTAGR